jgi:hypothetical protein
MILTTDLVDISYIIMTTVFLQFVVVIVPQNCMDAHGRSNISMPVNGSV